MAETKRIVLVVSEELHRSIKLKAITEGSTIQDKGVELFEKWLREKNDR